MEQPPPSGVSTVSAGGRAAKKITGTKQALPQRRRIQRGSDPLLPSVLQEAQTVDGTLPQGERGTKRSVVERSLVVGNRNKSRSVLEVPSADGQTYHYRIPKDKDERAAQLPLLMLTLAIREIGIGGDPLAVLDAFGFHQKDLDDKQVYPLTETLKDMLADGPVEAALPPMSNMGSSFQLGDDESD